MQTHNQNEVKREKDQPPKTAMKEIQQNHKASPVPVQDASSSGNGKMEEKLIDLNSRPQRTRGQTSMNEVCSLSQSLLASRVDLCEIISVLHVVKSDFFT